MKIAEILARGPSYSFEFFPPRTPAAEIALTAALEELEPLGPSYVSVTYGAGGSTRDKTHNIVTGILRDTSMTPMAHLTCVGHSRAELEEIVTRYRDAGIENILCLGGDPPADLDLPPGELQYAVELVELVRSLGDFSVGVAAFPEKHPEAVDLDADARVLAAKAEAGAEFAATQFFFRADDYFSLVARAEALGCDIPIIPGIMPITNLRQIQRFAELSGAEVPAEIVEHISAFGDDKAAVRAAGIELATKLCDELLGGGAPGLHFYTLNRSKATREIFTNLQVRA
ncbi:MAG: methylenetetrahydrofolate reductase [NAD(P)H] [Nocardioidaceae bacterium]